MPAAKINGSERIAVNGMPCEAAPAEIHQTYTGNVHQETRTTNTKAVWSKTINKR